MAIARTHTLLALDDFARIIGHNPLHFNQVQLDGVQIGCTSIVTQTDWQAAGQMGRETIAQAIVDAELAIQQELKYAPGPTWSIGEKQAYPSQGSVVGTPAGWLQGGFNTAGQWKSLQLDNGYYIGGGLETWTLIVGGRAVVYTDIDGDGYFETATVGPVAVGTGITDPNEVAIRYPGGDSQSEIRPTTVTLDGVGNATIVFRREQAVLYDDLYNYDVPQVAVEGTDNTSFLATVDVYRHYTDVSQQVTFRWEYPSGGWFLQGAVCGSCGAGGGGNCVACSFLTQSGCSRGRDYREGIVTVSPATWNAGTVQYDPANWGGCRVPDQALINYKHGLVDSKSGQMPDEWKRAVAQYAVVFLNRPICGCQTLENYVQYWAEDLAEVPGTGTGAGSGSRYQLTSRTTDNPLGTSRAAEHVYRMITRQKRGVAVLNL